MTAYSFIAFQKCLQSPFNLFLTFPKYLYAFFLQDKDARRVDWSDKVDQEIRFRVSGKSGVENTAKTRRPQPKSNTKNDRALYASKSSCIKNKEVKVEEYLRNLQSNGFQILLLFLAGYLNLFMGNILMEKVYYVEGLGYNLFSVGQFCDSDLENANLSISTPNCEFLDPKKKLEIQTWLEDGKIVDPLVSSDDVEYFDTFPTFEELGYHEWLLKYPKPSWVKAKIRTENLNNIKISYMIGHFLRRQAYIDLDSPISVMSKQHYKWIMSEGLKSRQKPSNPRKNSNFVGRVRGLKVFVGNFRETVLVYDQEEGTIVFKKDNEKITFKFPHKMETFNHIDFKDIDTNSIPPFILENNDNRGKTYYSTSLILGPEYREDESISKEIQYLMKLEREARKNKIEVT
nr:integrase, catalytic region, zinc finger, CCHC-type, peptidase aspartic, catalytic [Tanacetum cinerariifolium]